MQWDTEDIHLYLNIKHSVKLAKQTKQKPRDTEKSQKHEAILIYN